MSGPINEWHFEENERCALILASQKQWKRLVRVFKISKTPLGERASTVRLMIKTARVMAPGRDDALIFGTLVEGELGRLRRMNNDADFFEDCYCTVNMHRGALQEWQKRNLGK